ncbi:CHAT domain-containing protein [Tolypothrix bouteillei VB521301_2]|uniref:CHAT domain-containing protein n=1 Tax=Tolypothrix bouteillei TaxID=1246981 RepID=UPI000512D743
MSRKKILILSANPQDTDRVRLDLEVREIEKSIQRSQNRSEFEIATKWAVQVDDLRHALLDYKPNIVHFCGHGSGSSGLVLENSLGQSQLVSTESLARLFKFFQKTIECVLLNACYSEVQAEEIHQYINYVIGMNEAIGDTAAIKFAIGFYDALGAGNTYRQSFEHGCNLVELVGIPESQTPQLKIRPYVQANWQYYEHPFYSLGRTLSEMEQEAANLHCRQIYDELVAQGLVEGGARHIWAHLDFGQCVYNKWI